MPEPQNEPKREGRPPREGREGRPPGGGREGGGREGREGREGGREGRGPRFDGPPEIDLEKLMADSLYLDNQAHIVVSRMRDMDSGTKSQLRRLYNAVRRAVRAPENERQHEFVMLRARLAYTIARHSLRSLDTLEKLLLQVTRKNDARGYERFKDLFEAIIAYNE
jgi:CRISPR type III-A-associated protein Csm2